MADTSHITRKLREENQVHRPIPVAIMAYTDSKGIRKATQVRMVPANADFIFRTLRWATSEGITVQFLPL